MTAQSKKLLTDKDPFPVNQLDPEKSPHPILVVCDHAGSAVPMSLQSQIPPPHEMRRHIALDVGAKPLAQNIAKQLGSTLVMQNYSRLVIDMNRPHDSPELCPAVSDTTTIPFNQNLTDKDKAIRIEEIFNVYHGAISKILDHRKHQTTALLAVHSFTPQLKGQPPRSWHVDVISRQSHRIAERVQHSLQQECPDLKVGLNAVFAVTDQSDYTLRTHAESRSLPGISVEVRNDLLSTNSEINRWTELLSNAVRTAFGEHFTNQASKEM